MLRREDGLLFDHPTMQGAKLNYNQTNWQMSPPVPQAMVGSLRNSDVSTNRCTPGR
jgi:hypothetical protein